MRPLLKYRLQPLLDLKKRAKEKAEILLAQALALLEKEKKQLHSLEQQRETIRRRQKETRKKLHEKVSSGKALVKDGSFQVNFLRKLEEEEKEKGQQIEKQKRVVSECETEVKRARRDYISAVKELRIMEKHKGLWLKRVQKELSLREDREMDELGNVIHQIKQKNFIGEVLQD